MKAFNRFDSNRFTGGYQSLMLREASDAGHFFLHGIEKNGKLFLITDPEVHAFPSPAHLVVFDEKTLVALIDTVFTTWNIILSPEGDIFLATLEGMRKLNEEGLKAGRIELVSLPAANKAAEQIFFRVTCISTMKRISG